MRWELIKEKEEFKTIKYYNPVWDYYYFITYIYNIEKAKNYIKWIKTKYNILKMYFIKKNDRKGCLKVVYRHIKGPYRTQYFYNYRRLGIITASKYSFFCIE